MSLPLSCYDLETELRDVAMGQGILNGKRAGILMFLSRILRKEGHI